MKKNRKVILCASAVACASTVTAGAVVSVLSAKSFASNAETFQAKMPKYLGTDEDGIAQYAFNDEVISFNGKYYENSKYAVRDNIIQGELANSYDKKIIIQDEKFVGTADEEQMNGGQFSKVKVDEAIKANKLFKTNDGEVPVEQRIVPLYENGRNNSESNDLSQRFTTDLHEAQKRSISNYSSGTRYTDGFGNTFDRESEAQESNRQLMEQKTTYGQGYYKIDDRSVPANGDGSPASVNINPLNKYDRDVLKRLGINNLGVRDTDFELELYNKANADEIPKPQEGEQAESEKTYALRSADTGTPSKDQFLVPTDGLYQSSSDKVALNVAGLFSNYVFDKLREKLTYDVTLNPTFMKPFVLKLHRNISKSTLASFGIQGSFTPDDLENGRDNSWADKDYGVYDQFGNKANRSNRHEAYFRLTVNGKQEHTIPNVSYDNLNDMIETFTNKDRFREKFQISTKKEYAWFYKDEFKFAEKATLPKGTWGINEDIVLDYDGQEKGNWKDLGRAMDYNANPPIVSSSTIPTIGGYGGTQSGYVPSAPERFYGEHGRSIMANASFVHPAGDYRDKADITDFQWYDDSAQHIVDGKAINSGMAVNLKITPRVKASRDDITGWAKDFIKTVKKAPQVYNSLMDVDGLNLTTEIEKLFEHFADYLLTNLNGQQKIQTFNGTSSSNFFKPIGTMTSDGVVENSSSFLWDFIQNEKFTSNFRTKYLDKKNFAIKKNIQNNDTYLIMKYRGVPLFALDNQSLENLGVLDQMVRTNSNGGTYFDLEGARKALQSLVVSPNSSRLLMDSMANISNKIQVITTINEQGRAIKRFVLNTRNLDNDPSNDTPFIKFENGEDASQVFKKIHIDDKFDAVSNNGNTAVDGIGLLPSKNDQLDLLKKQSGIYLIAKQYNKQLDNFYEEAKKNNWTISKDMKEGADLVHTEDDILVLYNQALLNTGNMNPDKDKVSDSLEPAYFGESFQRQGTYNVSLNNTMKPAHIFSYSDDKKKFFDGITSNKVQSVYVYLDANNNQLNQNIYNDKEAALQEACINLHLLPSTTYGLLIKPEKFKEGKKASEYKIEDGYVVKKQVKIYKSINMGKLADSYNHWSTTPTYFSNFENAFNYCRYLFELSYTSRK